MTALSLAEVRRRLCKGAECEAAWIGRLNTRRILGDGGPKDPEELLTRRRVVQCTSTKLVTVMLDGAMAGREVQLHWQGVAVREDEPGVLLFSHVDDSADFLRVQAIRPPAPAGPRSAYPGDRR